MIHVCYGTQAELIKLAPILRELDARGVPHRVIDTGQHFAQTESLRPQLGLRPPDCVLWSGRGVYSKARAALWSAEILARCLLDRPRLRRQAFAPGPGVVVVHGDTMSTMLLSAMARMLGLVLAHVESGLRSYRWLHPFPEEIIRVIANRWARLLLAPGDWAADNLRRMKVKGRIVTLPANTGKDALDYVLSQPCAGAAIPPQPYALASIHRFETVTSPACTRKAVEVVIGAARRLRVVWPLHTVTRAAIERAGLMPSLQAANVELRDIQPYAHFAVLLREASFVIADGGSIQEESWFLDKPCLLLRHATERQEGLGENVVLSRWDAGVIEQFLANPQNHRRRTAPSDESPSRRVVDELLRLERQGRNAK